MLMNNSHLGEHFCIVQTELGVFDIVVSTSYEYLVN